VLGRGPAATASLATWALAQGDADVSADGAQTHPAKTGVLALIRIQRTVSRLAADLGAVRAPILPARNPR
jgi:hypothetical protein